MRVQNSLVILTLLAVVCFGGRLCDAARLQFTFLDTVGDPLDAIDLTKVLFAFDNDSGDFEVTVKADETNPLDGSHLLYLYVFNPDAGSTDRSVSFFEIGRFGFDADEPTTMLTRTGNSTVLTHWKLGDRVASYDVLGVPEGMNPGFNSRLGGNTANFNSSDQIRDVSVIVPEPISLLLAIAAMAGCLALHRRTGSRC